MDQKEAIEFPWHLAEVEYEKQKETRNDSMQSSPMDNREQRHLGSMSANAPVCMQPKLQRRYKEETGSKCIEQWRKKQEPFDKCRLSFTNLSTLAGRRSSAAALLHLLGFPNVPDEPATSDRRRSVESSLSSSPATICAISRSFFRSGGLNCRLASEPWLRLRCSCRIE
uniref:Uncharacterized protein n=1 Tax=Anopheles atroparvus TaxID=41427 RepID=A0A182JKU5_ANOAO